MEKYVGVHFWERTVRGREEFEKYKLWIASLPANDISSKPKCDEGLRR